MPVVKCVIISVIFGNAYYTIKSLLIIIKSTNCEVQQDQNRVHFSRNCHKIFQLLPACNISSPIDIVGPPSPLTVRSVSKFIMDFFMQVKPDLSCKVRSQKR